MTLGVKLYYTIKGGRLWREAPEHWMMVEPQASIVMPQGDGKHAIELSGGVVAGSGGLGGCLC